jgi:hypothetical protein
MSLYHAQERCSATRAKRFLLVDLSLVNLSRLRSRPSEQYLSAFIYWWVPAGIIVMNAIVMRQSARMILSSELVCQQALTSSSVHLLMGRTGCPFTISLKMTFFCGFCSCFGNDKELSVDTVLSLMDVVWILFILG